MLDKTDIHTLPVVVETGPKTNQQSQHEEECEAAMANAAAAVVVH